MATITPTPTPSTVEEETPSLNAFAHLSKGAPAPYWLFMGICSAWGIEPSTADMPLITVSENATFRLDINGKSVGVVRVSQPGYVGGPKAIESEIKWLGALHDIDNICLIDPVPTSLGSFITTIKDSHGVGWCCVSTKFIEGTVLEDLENPAPYYKTIGTWSALFHEHARTWKRPYGFTRFTWDIDNMVGISPRWGRWEEIEMTPSEIFLLNKAQNEALSVLSHAPRDPSHWGLIHADLRPSNVMAHGNKLTVIDFDDCGFGWYMYDYAASLSFVEHESYAQDMAQQWMQGYEEVSPLLQEDVQLASALSLMRRLTMLGWTVNHREDALPDGLFSAQLPGTIQVAQNYLTSHTWLLD